MASDETFTFNMDPRISAGAALWHPSARIVAISAGGQHNLLLTDAGTVLACGSNERGQADVPSDVHEAVAIAAGYAHSLALLRNGSVVAWGNNTRGATNVPSGLDDVVAISAGGGHSAAVRSNGTVVVWGQLGHGDLGPPEGLNDAKSIASGWETCFVVRRNGALVAWGQTQMGPPEIPHDLTGIVSVDGCDDPSPGWIAAKDDGTVLVGGYRDRTAPELVDIVQVAAGQFHRIARGRDGEIVGWGESEVRHTVPSGLREITAVSAGSDHSLALRTDGTVIAWGKNGYQQLHGPSECTMEFAEWDVDGYYLPSLGSSRKGAQDPYASQYGQRIANFEDLSAGDDVVPSETDIRRTLKRALDAENRGDREQAVKIYRAAVAHSATYPRLHALTSTGFALYWMRRGELSAAINILEQLADTGESYGLDSLAQCLLERGDFDEAIERFQEALERWDESSVDRENRHEQLRANTTAGLGLALRRSGDFDSAIAWFEKALHTGEMDRAGRFFTSFELGSLLSERGQLDEAITWFRVAAESENAKYHAALGVALQKAGMREEGIFWLTKAADEGYVIAMVLVGSTLAASSDPSEANIGWGWVRKAASVGDPSAIELIASTGGVGLQRGGHTPSSGSGSQSGGGCYIATAVYGSYDAPQVQLLRRFRDGYLCKSVLGRLFIRTYYSISPGLARRLGGHGLLSRTIKKILDRVVVRLDQQ